MFLGAVYLLRKPSVASGSKCWSQELEGRKEAKQILPQETRCGHRSQKGASRVKMLLQKQRCGCTSEKLAAGANMWLQNPMYDYKSKDVTAGAMMWLQEPRCGCRSHDVAAGAKMWQHKNSVKEFFVLLLQHFVFLVSQSFGAALFGSFWLGAKFNYSDPCLLVENPLFLYSTTDTMRHPIR